MLDVNSGTIQTKVSVILFTGSVNSTPLYVSPSAHKTNSRKDIDFSAFDNLVTGACEQFSIPEIGMVTEQPASEDIEVGRHMF